MKNDIFKFLREISLFLIFIFVGFTLIILSVRFEIRRNANFRLKSDIHQIIIGHSHAACTYNDSLIPHFKNLAQSGESYFYTYFKLQKLIEANPQIKKVYIEFTNNQIDTSMERWTFHDPYLSTRLAMYWPFIDLSSQCILFKKNPTEFVKTSPIAIRKVIERIFLKKFNYAKIIGGHEPNNKSLINCNTLNKGQQKSIDHFDSKDVSYTNIEYLKKMIKFLNSKRIAYTLIRSPLHSQSFLRKNESTFQKILTLDLRSSKRFIDFSNLKLPNDKYYDFDHLNSKGAEIYSKIFSNYLVELEKK